MRKSILLILSLGLLIVLAACGGQTETETPLVKITVSNNGAASQAPIYIAHAEGYFTEQGLDVELVRVNRSSEAIAGMISGDIDVVPASNSIAMLNAITLEEGIQVVADRGTITKDGCTYLAILIGKEYYDSGEITGPADLVNHPMRVDATGVNAYLMSFYLAQAGLTLNDMDLVDLPPSVAQEALASQTIAASNLSEPRLTAVINSGVAVQVAGMEDFVDDYQISVMGYSKRLTIEDRDLGVRFMIGYLKGVRQYNEGKTPRNLEILAEYTELPQEDIEMACWISIRADGRISYDAFLDYQEWSVSVDDLEAVVPEVIYWDPYFVEEAYAILNK